MTKYTALLSMLSPLAAGCQPTHTVTGDNTLIRESCEIVIAPGAVIADADGNGVIQIAADGITVTFARGSELWGGKPGGPWDEYKGTGISLNGHKNVTFKDARVHGFKVGLWATKCDALTIDGGDFSDNYRAHLRSTPAAEDGADWLFPHHNDNDEWAKNYGGAIYIREATGVTIKDIKIRRGQNGILLNRVDKSRVYDNDCSFLTGWGLGMFRSSDNIVTRNAFDFCVRGHSEGVYNRGQDSAGILMFEQCSRNTIAENSATHGGDSIFGFAGLEALNGEGAPAGYDFKRKGCNDNLFLSNDLSYAPAHGLEMTFSFGNVIMGNRFVENAICGVWGGYSQETRIEDNEFTGNGGMAYGDQRGGVNIEHSRNNSIVRNRFTNNKCGVYIWWHPHDGLVATPWGKANYTGISGNTIADNTVTIDANHPFKNPRGEPRMTWLQLSQTEAGRVKDTIYAGNRVTIDAALGDELKVTKGIELATAGPIPPRGEIPKHTVLGKNHPVGARPSLRGRDQIIMDEWGPWDHESPILRAVNTTGVEHTYELLGATKLFLPGYPPQGVKVTSKPKPGTATDAIITVSGEPGVHSYNFKIVIDGKESNNTVIDGKELKLSGTLIGARWTVTAFPWDKDTPPWVKDASPQTSPEMLARWRGLAKGDKAVTATVAAIKFNYGGGGPKNLNWSPEMNAKGPGSDYFGTIAESSFTLPKGKWKLSTLSDDGVRVMVNGKTVIERWNWHGPERDTAVFEQAADGNVDIVVEHFEIDGHAVLEFNIEPAE